MALNELKKGSDESGFVIVRLAETVELDLLALPPESRDGNDPMQIRAQKLRRALGFDATLVLQQFRHARVIPQLNAMHPPSAGNVGHCLDVKNQNILQNGDYFFCH
jgi:hypothetical protein